MVSSEARPRSGLEVIEGKEYINGIPVVEIINIFRELQGNLKKPLHEKVIPGYPFVRLHIPELSSIDGSSKRAQAMWHEQDPGSLYKTDQVRVFGEMTPELKGVYQSKEAIVFVGPGNGKTEVERIKDVFNCRTSEDPTGEMELQKLKEENFFKEKIIVLRDVNQSVNEAAADYIGEKTGIKVTHTTGDFRNASMLNSVIRYGNLAFVSLGYTVGNYEIEEVQKRIDMLRPNLHPHYGEKLVHLYFTMNTDRNVEESMARYDDNEQDAHFLKGAFAALVTTECGNIKGEYKRENCFKAIHGNHGRIVDSNLTYQSRVLGGVEVLNNDMTKEGIEIKLFDSEQGEDIYFTLKPGEKYFFLQSKRPDNEYFISLIPEGEDYEMQLQTVDTVTACSMRLPTKAKEEDVMAHKRNWKKWIRRKTRHELKIMLNGAFVVMLALIFAERVNQYSEAKYLQETDLKRKEQYNRLVEQKAAQLYRVMSADIDEMLKDTLNSDEGRDSACYGLMYHGIQSVNKNFVQAMITRMKTMINEVYDIDSLKKTDAFQQDFEGQVVDILRSHIITDSEFSMSLPAGSERFRKLLYNLVLNPDARKKAPFPEQEIMYGPELIQFIYGFFDDPFIENYLTSRGVYLVKKYKEI